MADVWDAHWFGSTKTLDVHVAALRRKLAAAAAAAGTPAPEIATLRGHGYRLETTGGLSRPPGAHTAGVRRRIVVLAVLAAVLATSLFGVPLAIGGRRSSTPTPSTRPWSARPTGPRSPSPATWPPAGAPAALPDARRRHPAGGLRRRRRRGRAGDGPRPRRRHGHAGPWRQRSPATTTTTASWWSPSRSPRARRVTGVVRAAGDYAGVRLADRRHLGGHARAGRRGDRRDVAGRPAAGPPAGRAAGGPLAAPRSSSAAATSASAPARAASRRSTRPGSR